MFERFTQGARDVVSGAVGYAGRAGEPRITEEHLLLALLDARGTKASSVLSSLGVTGRREQVAGALADARRRGGISRADADALAGLGIDIDEIVGRIEEEHGPDAPAPGRTGARTLRRTLAPGAKETLRIALRTAVAHRERHLGDEHLLLALIERGGVAADALAACGVSYEDVERVLRVGGLPGAA
ncbi:MULTISPECIES: Clp protease N-terminal domain-containing protein [unclassified Streptomyces]|uniref:Clp protease N-terminal domain-containing protein n=1 Tax=unclassified Streptomyces TaxID=2593676 RepID=UPI002E1C6314|nr:peptidase [Streptomyces sp. NBC_01023]